MANASMSLIVWFGAKQVIDGQLTAGDLGTYVIMSIQIGFSLSRSVSLYSSIMKALGAGERSFKLIDRYSHIAPYGGDKSMISTQTKYSYKIDDSVKSVEDIFDNNSKYVQFDSMSQDDDEDKYESVQDEGIKFAYPSRPEVVVLNDLSFSAKPGQITA